MDSLGSLGWYSTAEIIKVDCGQLRQVFYLFPLYRKVKNEVSRVMMTNDPNRSSLSSWLISPSSFKIGFGFDYQARRTTTMLVRLMGSRRDFKLL